MKKAIVYVLIALLITLPLTGCSALHEVAVEGMRETAGDAYAQEFDRELYRAEAIMEEGWEMAGELCLALLEELGDSLGEAMEELGENIVEWLEELFE